MDDRTDWEAIGDRYRADRSARQALHPTAAPNVCRYCAKQWKPWAGSQLDGHVKCIISPELRTEVVTAIHASTLQIEIVSQRTGIPHAWLTAWYRRWCRGTR